MISPSPSDASRAARISSFGHAALAAFSLAPELVHLNHGSFGAVPACAAAEQERLRRLLERDPTGFFKDVYPPAVRAAAANAAGIFGGAAEEWVFCENATAAVNAVLASLPFRPGDELLTTSHAYGAVLKAMRIWAARRDATVRRAEIPVVVESESDIVEAVVAAFTPRTRLLVIDHITSPTAMLFPVKAIVARAHAEGIPVFVDGAHVPGHLTLDVGDVAADWYTGNAHKWLFAPRGCGLLWTAPRWQEITRPAVLSHGSEDCYTEAFDWIGTRDVTPWLSFAAAAEAHRHFGGSRLIAHNRALAHSGGMHIAARTGSCLTAPESMRGAMAAIVLRSGATAEEALRLRDTLKARGYVVAANTIEGELCLRVSAQVYNELSDYETLATALADLGFVA